MNSTTEFINLEKHVDSSVLTDAIDNKLTSHMSGSTSDNNLSADNKQFKNNLHDKHPYKHLLVDFEPTNEQLSPLDNIVPPKSLQQTPLDVINKKDDFEKLVEELKNEKELGIDVEWSDHGYKAVTCLVQISTKDKDFIIDAMILKDHMILLNDIFTDPKIVKIFHAASNDLKWLQLDFGIFLINMFDTQRAMKALSYKKLGLHEVLTENYNITKNKKMQRVDFRRRPLPPEYLEYARTDSHFLINFYHKLKNNLIQANLLQEVVKDCNNDCRTLFEKVVDGTYSAVRNIIVMTQKGRSSLSEMQKRQLIALEKINSWRHSVAEYVDKNTGYILSKKNMQALVLAMPVDAPTIVKISKSEYVRNDIEEIVNIMLEANSGVPCNRENRKRKLEGGNLWGFNHNKRKRRRWRK